MQGSIWLENTRKFRAILYSYNLEKTRLAAEGLPRCRPEPPKDFSAWESLWSSFERIGLVVIEAANELSEFAFPSRGEQVGGRTEGRMPGGIVGRRRGEAELALMARVAETLPSAQCPHAPISGAGVGLRQRGQFLRRFIIDQFRAGDRANEDREQVRIQAH